MHFCTNKLWNMYGHWRENLREGREFFLILAQEEINVQEDQIFLLCLALHIYCLCIYALLLLLTHIMYILENLKLNCNLGEEFLNET